MSRQTQIEFEQIIANASQSSQVCGDSYSTNQIDRPELFTLSQCGKLIHRFIHRRDGSRIRSTLRLITPVHRKGRSLFELAALYDQAYLRGARVERGSPSKNVLRFVDLFCGAGFMSAGVVEAAKGCGFRAVPRLAWDTDTSAVETYVNNFSPCRAEIADISIRLPGQFDSKLTAEEVNLRRRIGAVDLLIGGPPCQGHSSFNNFTRGSDPKNALYLKMGRAAAVLQPDSLIIENVASVLNDRGRVVDLTAEFLAGLGYRVWHGTIDLSKLGVAQSRKRHILIASQRHLITGYDLLSRYEVPLRGVGWAIGDLLGANHELLIDQPSKITPIAKKRIDFLFNQDLFDLPDSKRPPCHRFKEHSYKSVYGRLHWDSPAQTITGGFNCMGQGRFVHPRHRRVITPHEAARIQFIPDSFSFVDSTGRTKLSELIGNAVPPKLTYVVTCELFR